jgi:monovalent cation/hydrogen antiporter
MLMLEWVLVLLLAAVVLTNLAERLAVPYPSLLAIAGAGLAFLPFAPQIRIEPELALALFVAPALLDAAFDTSPRGLRDNALPVASMAVVAVVLTTAAIASWDGALPVCRSRRRSPLVPVRLTSQLKPFAP